ncbi:MAG TPA: DUF1080 domain-containing protein, partial [Lacipirellulaceae bacterium]|nr:DUF1080 domain-containing protein [Lacipirellulaceae bacterium]
MSESFRKVESRSVLLWAVLFCGIAPPASHGESNAEEAVTPVDGAIRLFDGQSLGDCYVWLKDSGRSDPRRVFRVSDGTLHITGDGFGGLVTNKAYCNYHLVLEYRWGGRTWGERANAARDSGLLVHSTGVDGGFQGIWMPSIEVQIIEGGVGDFILVSGKGIDGRPVPLSLTATVIRDRDDEVVWAPDGTPETFDNSNRRRINWQRRDPDWKDEKGFRGPDDLDSPQGAWTRLDVIADG